MFSHRLCRHCTVHQQSSRADLLLYRVGPPRCHRVFWPVRHAQGVVVLRSLLQDRMAALNGRTVEYVLKQDRPAFVRLIGLSVAQVDAPWCSCFIQSHFHHV